MAEDRRRQDPVNPDEEDTRDSRASSNRAEDISTAPGSSDVSPGVSAEPNSSSGVDDETGPATSSSCPAVGRSQERLGASASPGNRSPERRDHEPGQPLLRPYPDRFLSSNDCENWHAVSKWEAKPANDDLPTGQTDVDTNLIAMPLVPENRTLEEGKETLKNQIQNQQQTEAKHTHSIPHEAHPPQDVMPPQTYLYPQRPPYTSPLQLTPEQQGRRPEQNQAPQYQQHILWHPPMPVQPGQVPQLQIDRSQAPILYGHQGQVPPHSPRQGQSTNSSQSRPVQPAPFSQPVQVPVAGQAIFHTQPPLNPREIGDQQLPYSQSQCNRSEMYSPPESYAYQPQHNFKLEQQPSQSGQVGANVQRQEPAHLRQRSVNEEQMSNQLQSYSDQIVPVQPRERSVIGSNKASPQIEANRRQALIGERQQSDPASTPEQQTSQDKSRRNEGGRAAADEASRVQETRGTEEDACMTSVLFLSCHSRGDIDVTHLKQEILHELSPDRFPHNKLKTVYGLLVYYMDLSEWEMNRLMGGPDTVERALQELDTTNTKMGDIVHYFTHDDRTKRLDIVRRVKTIHSGCEFCARIYAQFNLR